MYSVVTSILVCTLLSAVGYGQGSVGKIQSKFNSFTAFSVGFKQTGSGFARLEGKLTYSRSGGYRIEMGSILIVSDGATTWNYNKKEKKVIISTASAADESLLSLDAIINDYPAQCTVTETVKAGKAVITLVPKSAKTIKYREIIIEADGDNLVTSVSLKGADTKVMRLEFTGYKLNIAAARSEFSFTPPKGTKVIDLR